MSSCSPLLARISLVPSPFSFSAPLNQLAPLLHLLHRTALPSLFPLPGWGSKGTRRRGSRTRTTPRSCAGSRGVSSQASTSATTRCCSVVSRSSSTSSASFRSRCTFRRQCSAWPTGGTLASLTTTSASTSRTTSGTSSRTSSSPGSPSRRSRCATTCRTMASARTSSATRATCSAPDL